MNIQDVSGNVYEVTIEDFPTEEVSEELFDNFVDDEVDQKDGMEQFTELSDVSSGDVSAGDAYQENDSSVSGGDFYPGTVYQVEQADNSEILESLTQLNYTASALLFFTIFVWAESKLHSGTRRLSDKWKK